MRHLKLLKFRQLENSRDKSHTEGYLALKSKFFLPYHTTSLRYSNLNIQ